MRFRRKYKNKTHDGDLDERYIAQILIDCDGGSQSLLSVCKGGNNLAKILAKKFSGKLSEVASKLKMPIFEQSVAQKTEKDILLAGQIKKKTGSGYEYPMKGSLLYLNESVEGSALQIWEYLAEI